MPNDPRGPQDGYDFGTKRQYRRTIWAGFRRELGNQTADKRALLIVDADDGEIEVALQNGFREHNLFVVNWSPAIVAWKKRRFPRIHTFGVELRNVAGRLRDAGVTLHAANFDLCSPAYQRTLHQQISPMLSPDLYEAENVIAVTVLRGRDPHLWSEIFKGSAYAWRESKRAAYKDNPRFRSDVLDQPDNDLGRFLFLGTLLERGCSDMNVGPDSPPLIRHSKCYAPVGPQVGKYRSTAGTQTMLWSLFVRHRLPCGCQDCVG